MPWKDVSAMSLRLELVTLATAEGANVRGLCRRYGISPQTAYKWIDRFKAAGPAGLEERSRRPNRSPHRCDSALEKRILKLRDAHPKWGARKLRARLLTLGTVVVPSPSTITAVLKRHGRLNPEPDPAHRAFIRFEHDAPNRLWQMDFKGHFPVGDGRCHPLTVLDDHSRFAIGLVACGNEQAKTVQDALTELFRRYGLPERILCDNGPPWGHPETRYTALGVWLLRVGVGLSHGRPCHPQTQGKDERFHRTLNAEVIQGRLFHGLDGCQRHFDEWREVYNHQRPHESLGMDVPAHRYRPSERAFPEVLPQWEYGSSDAVRRVQTNGTINFGGREYDLGQAFRRQRVAVRPADQDGLFGVYFGVHQIAELDLKARDRTPC